MTISSAESILPSTNTPQRRKPMRMTPAKLRAQRANAQRSTGPRTIQGRRRSSQNRRQLPLTPGLAEHFRWRKADPAEVKRLWQDLFAVFWFVQPECHAFLQWAAVSWWRKVDTLRERGSQYDVDRWDREIEQHLRSVLERFARENQRWKGWLRKEVGDDGQQGLSRLRAAVEARLTTFRDKVWEAPPVGAP